MMNECQFIQSWRDQHSQYDPDDWLIHQKTVNPGIFSKSQLKTTSRPQYKRYSAKADLLECVLDLKQGTLIDMGWMINWVDEYYPGMSYQTVKKYLVMGEFEQLLDKVSNGSDPIVLERNGERDVFKEVK